MPGAATAAQAPWEWEGKKAQARTLTPLFTSESKEFGTALGKIGCAQKDFVE